LVDSSRLWRVFGRRPCRLLTRTSGCRECKSGMPFARRFPDEQSKRAMRRWERVQRFASIGCVALALGPPAEAAEAQSPLARVHDIAMKLGSCWRPPHDDDQVTVRISFTREGAVIGEPKIAFVQSSGGPADDAALADSMKAAIHDCTPFNFSARLGSAIAGRVLAIRFIGPRRATIIDQD
jgi:hypothetical protein